MLLTAGAWAQTGNAAYPLTVTVQSSQVSIQCDKNQCNPYLVISAEVGGRHLEMQGGKARDGYLMLGDYKARLVSDKHKKPYFSEQVYELQYPDGATDKFAVTGESK